MHSWLPFEGNLTIQGQSEVRVEFHNIDRENADLTGWGNLLFRPVNKPGLQIPLIGVAEVIKDCVRLIAFVHELQIFAGLSEFKKSLRKGLLALWIRTLRYTQKVRNSIQRCRSGITGHCN